MSEYRSPRLPAPGANTFYVSEDTAMEIAGAFHLCTAREGHFPSDLGSMRILGSFKTSGIRPSDLDTTFEFENYLPGWSHSPSQIDVRFPNGKGLRFCFSGIVYDLAKVPSGGCPEHP